MLSNIHIDYLSDQKIPLKNPPSFFCLIPLDFTWIPLVLCMEPRMEARGPFEGTKSQEMSTSN